MKEAEPDMERRQTVDSIIGALLVVFLAASAFSIAIAQSAYFIALAIWVAKMAIARRSLFPRTPLDWYFVAFGVAEIVSTLFSDFPAYSALYAQRRLTIIPIVYILMGNVSSEKTVKIFVLAFLASATGVALWSLRVLVLDFQAYATFQKRLGEFQIYMTTGTIMMFASLLVMPFVMNPHVPRKMRMLAAGALLPVLLTLLFTFTRSAWLGFIVGVAVIVLRKPRFMTLMAVAAVVIVSLLAVPALRDRAASIVDPQDATNSFRLNLWAIGLRIAADHPIVGIGDVGAETVWDDYAPPDWKPEGHFHSNIVHWLVTLGGLGLAVIVLLFVRLGTVLWRLQRRHSGEWFAGSVTLGAFAGLVAFHVNGLFEWSFGDTEVAMQLWAMVGMALAAAKVIDERGPASGAPHTSLSRP